MLDTSFIDDFIDIMEQYCYYRNRFKVFHLRLLYINNLNSIFDTESTNIYSIDSKKYIITKIDCWPVFKQDSRHLWHIWGHHEGPTLLHIHYIYILHIYYKGMAFLPPVPGQVAPKVCCIIHWILP